MGNVMSKNGKNNLELYLKDVYKNECVFKMLVDDEEIEFIQTGIEILVQKIVDLLHDENFYLDNDTKQEGKSLVEVYFPIKIESELDKLLYGRIPNIRSPVIPVGSFYEETKNNYPDEFDFIFLLYCLRKAPTVLPDYDFLNIFRKLTEKRAEFLHYTSVGTADAMRKLKFVQIMKEHGPAIKLQFLYETDTGEKREIYADIVPAIKIIPSNLRKVVKEWCGLQPFRKKICDTGSVLYTHNGINFSFTETELHFMRNMLSSNHIKLYRILKYIINGHGDDDSEEFVYNGVRLGVSSYLIKVTIIFHHYECTDPDKADIGTCLLQVLDKTSNFQYTPTLLGTGQVHMNVFTVRTLIYYLRNLLELMQSLDFGYDYSDFKSIESVSKIFLGLNLQGSQKIFWPGSF